MYKNIRLPGHIAPVKYDIHIKPDFDNFSLEGKESIRIKIGKPTRKIALHSKDLEIESAEFILSKGKIWPKRTVYNEKRETVAFVFPKKLPKCEGELHLVFRGVLNDKMRGFYRSPYFHKGGEKFMATTQFESTDARRAFPCFDEPARKAVFEINLEIPGHMTAISNTIETEIKEHESGYKIVRFAPTPKMSTYLVAFIVGEFEHVEGRTKEGVKVRVFTTPGKKHQAKFALDCASKTISFYNKYFAIPYPLPTLDLIAIPDFAAGAMENWGAVTYRESAILVDEEHSSAHNKQWVALVIAHELAHQWFGNLVTMEWWTHLWLNEGFASYMEYLAVDHLFPKWNIWNQFAYQELGEALELDALKNTHPIEVEVRHPEEISEIFDAVSYSKGASVIKMLADYLGENDFRDGLRHYLKRHAYSNAATDDLWRALEEVSGKPVRKIMKAYTGQSGYPLVGVKTSGSKIIMSQDRFYSSSLSRKVDKKRVIWPIPVSFISNGSKTPTKVLLYGKRSVITKPQAAWLKFNAGESGVYRTAYSADLLDCLEGPIKAKKLSVVDRLGLARDAFALAEAGYIGTTSALEIFEAYIKETDYAVWMELISSLRSLDSLLAGKNFHGLFRRFAAGLISGAADKVGWRKRNGEPHTQTLLRSLILRSFGHFGDADTVGEARRLFETMRYIDPDLRDVVYRLTAENGSGKDYASFKKRYVNEPLQEEKARLAGALTSFGDKKLLVDCLNFSLTKNVRLQNTPQFVGGVISNPSGTVLGWAFLKKNWKKMMDLYGEGGHMLPRLIMPLSRFADVRYAREIDSFFKKTPAPGAQLRRDGKNIEVWLKSRR